MKKLLLLTFLSLTIATNITSKQFSFELNSGSSQVDLSSFLGGSIGMFEVEFLYFDNISFSGVPLDDDGEIGIHVLFTGSFNNYEEDDDDGHIESDSANTCRLNDDNEYNTGYSTCKYNVDAEDGYAQKISRFFINHSNAFINCSKFIPENPSEDNHGFGCLSSECTFDYSATMYTRITGPFNDGVGSSDEIDDLQAQIDELVEQLTGCVDCVGDVNSSSHVNVTDVVLMVEHILDAEDGECISN